MRIRGLYDITNKEISKHGGPDPVTLSRISKDSHIAAAHATEEYAWRIANSFGATVVEAYPSLQAGLTGICQMAYEEIKKGLDADKEQEARLMMGTLERYLDKSQG